MSDPSAILCQGTTMSFDSASVGGVMSITGIGSGTAADIDITTFASTCKEFVQGLRDFGTISVQLRRNQDDTGQLAMFNAMASQLTKTVVITLPSSTANVITFSAYVKSISNDLKADGAVEGKAELRIVSAPVFT